MVAVVVAVVVAAASGADRPTAAAALTFSPFEMITARTTARTGMMGCRAPANRVDKVITSIAERGVWV